MPVAEHHLLRHGAYPVTQRRGFEHLDVGSQPDQLRERDSFALEFQLGTDPSVVVLWLHFDIASTALGEALAYVGDPVGLSRLLVTCDERNPVSRKAIEACGGLLASVRPADQLSRNVGCSRDTLRYWVRTSVSSVR